MVEVQNMSYGSLKVVLFIVLIAGDALVRGGTLDIGAEKHAHGLDIVVRAEGSRIVLDPELRSVLVGETGEDEVAPRAAAAWLVHCLVQEGGGSIQVADGEENMLLIGAALPA
jgi:histidine phosphotransferase ChpT